MIRVVFVIIHYENVSLTRRCLESLKQYSNQQIKTIVFDNGSKDRSVELLSKQFLEIDFIFHPCNSGFCEGNNRAVTYAIKKYSPAYIFLLNNDAHIIKGSIDDLIKFMEERNNIGIAGPRIIDTNTNTLWSAGGEINMSRGLCRNRGIGTSDNASFHSSERVDFVSGCAMIIRRDVIDAIGLFDPAYGAYMEDVDLCCRARKRGFDVFYYPFFIVGHTISQSFGGEYSSLASFYRWRNRLIFMKKHAVPNQFSRFLFMLFPFIAIRDVMRYALLFQWKSIPELFRGLTSFILISYGKHKKNSA